MSAPTTFTVAIPTHQRRETVVLAALSAARQSRPPEEVLVLCDGCTDGTAEAVAALGDPRIRAIELPKGPGYAYAHRDVAVERGTGSVVTWLADDDLYLPDHLERIGEVWDAGGVDLVLAPALIVHEDDRLEWIGRDWRVPAHRTTVLDDTNTSVMASVSIRRELVADLGGWDGTIERAADWDLWKRALEMGAQPGWSDEVSVLHFRATTRRQAWSLRVAQNTRWFARLTQPEAQAELRDAARLARSTWEGTLTDELRELRRIAEQATDEARRAHEAAAGAARRTAELEQHAAAIAGELAEARLQVVQAEHGLREAERLAAQVDGLSAELVAARRDQATLQAIYAGGWWRLRGVLRRLLRRPA